MRYCCRLETPWGSWHMTATERGITSVDNQPLTGEESRNACLDLAERELQAYFRGERKAFTVPLDPAGTAFQREVWNVLREIPFGETLAYSQVAARMGRPAAARAVGQAVGRNPCLILIPCHRVMGKDGSLTGFSAGTELKIKLLALERQKEP